MDITTQGMPPAGARPSPSKTGLKDSLELVVPRSLLDLLAAPDPHRAGTGQLANGRLNFQALSDRIQALVAGHQLGLPQRLPLAARPAARSGGWPERGLAVLYAAAPDEAPPTGPAPCEAWLARHAPEFRLACNSLRPDVALLWLGSDGRAQAWLRPGDGWAAVADRGDGAAGCDHSDASVHRPAWRPFGSVRLPGAQMLTMHRTAAGELRWPRPTNPSSDLSSDSDPDPAHAQPAMFAPGVNEPAEPDRAGRYSRLAAALSAPVLTRFQALRFAVVGCDRSGSMLAHSLGRMGANLLLLDPARMTPESRDADLPALHEGQAKPVALQHLLRGLQRPGARCDARALSASSPAAGQLLAETDVVLCCTANPEAQHWALALLKPLLLLQTGRTGERLWAELWLLPPGTGCLQCRADQRAGLERHRTPANPPQAAPRSWQGVAAHAALRLLEQHLAGRVPGGLRRHLEEDLDSARWTSSDTAWGARDAVTCPACRLYQGTGLTGLRAALDSGGLAPSTTPTRAP